MGYTTVMDDSLPLAFKRYMFDHFKFMINFYLFARLFIIFLNLVQLWIFQHEAVICLYFEYTCTPMLEISLLNVFPGYK